MPVPVTGRPPNRGMFLDDGLRGGAVTILAGVDLGGTKVQAVVLRDGERVGQARLPPPPKGSNDEIVEACAETAVQAFQEAGIEPSEAATLGLGAPGQTDEEG